MLSHSTVSADNAIRHLHPKRSLDAVMRLAEGLPEEQKRELLEFLLGNFDEKVLADWADKKPPGQIFKGSKQAGWLMPRPNTKVRTGKKKSSLRTYIEYWLSYEIRGKHFSHYLCQHPEGRAMRPPAQAKYDLVVSQLEAKRPIAETLARLGKQMKG